MHCKMVLVIIGTLHMGMNIYKYIKKKKSYSFYYVSLD